MGRCLSCTHRFSYIYLALVTRQSVQQSCRRIRLAISCILSHRWAIRWYLLSWFIGYFRSRMLVYQIRSSWMFVWPRRSATQFITEGQEGKSNYKISSFAAQSSAALSDQIHFRSYSVCSTRHTIVLRYARNSSSHPRPSHSGIPDRSLSTWWKSACISYLVHFFRNLHPKSKK